MRQIYLILVFLIVLGFLTNCQSGKVGGFKFEKSDQATRIVIDFVLTDLTEMTIGDIKDVRFANRFIKGYPNGWEKPLFSPTPAPLFWVTFYDNNNRILDSYGVGSDFLVYGPYWRPLAVQDRMVFMEALSFQKNK